MRTRLCRSLIETLQAETAVLRTVQEQSALAFQAQMNGLTAKLVHFKSHLLLKKSDLAEKIGAYGNAASTGATIGLSRIRKSNG